MMKSSIVWASILLLTTSVVVAQEIRDGNRREKVESLRVAFISQELSLTPDEAQKFWPVYNQFRGELDALRHNFKAGEEELSAEQKLDFEQKKLDLKKKYKTQFEAVLSKEKVNQLYGLEEKFRQKMKQMHDQRRDMKGGERHGGERGPR